MAHKPDQTQPPGAPRSPQAPALSYPPAIPRRLIGVLLAVALTGGIVTGAVLGPASAGPPTSDSPIVQRALALLAARELSASRLSAEPAAAPSTDSGTVTESAPAHGGKSTHAGASRAVAPSSPLNEAAASGPSSSEAPSPRGGASEPEKAVRKPIRLPPVQHVWLIVLSGSTLADATAAPTDYPYLAGQLVKQGTLLGSYTALDGYELAGDAALLPGGIGARLSVISEPGCDTSGAAGAPTAPGAPTAAGVTASAGAPCTEGAPAPPSEVDAFLKGVAGPILSSPGYREDGLIVITFGLASNGAEGPATTVALQPTAGVLLLSPLLPGGHQSSTPFDALAPRQSMETIFKR